MQLICCLVRNCPVFMNSLHFLCWAMATVQSLVLRDERNHHNGSCYFSFFQHGKNPSSKNFFLILYHFEMTSLGFGTILSGCFSFPMIMGDFHLQFYFTNSILLWRLILLSFVSFDQLWNLTHCLQSLAVIEMISSLNILEETCFVDFLSPSCFCFYYLFVDFSFKMKIEFLPKFYSAPIFKFRLHKNFPLFHYHQYVKNCWC